MKRSKKILVPLSGIEDGNHDFEFEIDRTFFEEYNHPDILDGKFSINLHLRKSPSVSTIIYQIHGYVNVPCDLCLDPFNLEMDGEEQLYVKSDSNFKDGLNDEVIFLEEWDSEIDLSQHVYDSICIRLPFRKTHPTKSDGKSDCNPEMLKKYNNHRQADQEKTDPRWDDLKKFLNDNN